MLIEDLNSFITRAEKSRKYAPNSATGIKVALGYFEKELNEEEQNSIDKFRDNFNAIYQSVIRKNQDKLSPGSLEVYKRRVWGLLKDFEEYANDPAKFVGWNPIRRVVVKKKNNPEKGDSNLGEKSNFEQDNNLPSTLEGLSKSEIPLRPGVKAVILVPNDLIPDDVEKIKLFIDYLSSLAKKT